MIEQSGTWYLAVPDGLVCCCECSYLRVDTIEVPSLWAAHAIFRTHGAFDDEGIVKTGGALPLEWLAGCDRLRL